MVQQKSCLSLHELQVLPLLGLEAQTVAILLEAIKTAPADLLQIVENNPESMQAFLRAAKKKGPGQAWALGYSLTPTIFHKHTCRHIKQAERPPTETSIVVLASLDVASRRPCLVCMPEMYRDESMFKEGTRAQRLEWLANAMPTASTHLHRE